MAWQSLYRRYRPRRFADVKGQDHVATALRNAVRDGRVGHAYLFSGPRGTGKTTCARIVAKALNCTDLHDGEPDLECESCRAVEAGTSYDLHELDAASNNGVEAVRDLITRAAMGTPGRTKVYILDEVHMLTTAASNALLKTLEEPPDHVVFVLATTDPQKVLPTIRSRTQHFEFNLIGAEELADHVRWVAADAGLEVTDEIVDHVVRVGGGSARDTLSALDQVLAAGGVQDRAGELDTLVAGVIGRDPGAVLRAVHEAVRSGRDPRVLAERLVGRMRDAFLSSVGVPLDHLPDADRERVADLVAHAERPLLTRSIEVLGTALVDMRQSADPRITFEAALVRLADAGADTSPAALLERLDRLERALAAGELPIGAAAAPTTAPAAGSAPPAPADGPAAPPSGRRSGVADEARRRLQQRAAGGPAAGARTAPTPRPPAAAPSAAQEPAPPPAPAPEVVAPSAPAAEDAPSAAPVAEDAPSAETLPPAPAPAPAPPVSPVAHPAPAAAGGGLPSLDELRQAWGDALVDRLDKRVKARFAGGRFTAVDGDQAVEFALPNAMHRDRCEEFRLDVERVLGEHFGRTVPLRLVVDAPAPEPRRPGGRDPEPDPDDGSDIDLDDLVDAPAEPQLDPVARLTQAFPGAALVDDEG